MHVPRDMPLLRGFRESVAHQTQEVAARETGVTLRTWQRWEAGESEPRGMQARALRRWINKHTKETVR